MISGLGCVVPFFAPHARIRIKCNHLTDPDIINALLLAVYAGVDVSIIVRTTCTMPLNTGEEKLEVHSIAGKYLEHDRFYLFEDGDDRWQCRADWLYLLRRSDAAQSGEPD